jgi:transcriptional regulator GlxA family with amidase domain
MARHQDGVYAGFHGEHSLQRWLKALYNAPMQAEAAFDALESGINPGAQPYPETDPRVARVVERIQSEIGRNVSVEELANSVNLSVSRLVELFRAQVGVPVRRYRQWHRLFVTFTGVERGASLTEAAIAAGFADSAHFSHTFRMTLGMKPSDIVTMLSGRIFVGHGPAVGAMHGQNAGAGLPTPAGN